MNRPSKGKVQEGSPRQPSPSPGFWRESVERELLVELERLGEDMRPNDARVLLENPFFSIRLMEKLLAIKALQGHYQLRKDLARSRLLPMAKAMAMVSTLYWRDLALMAADVQLRPQLRRHADQLLLQRLRKLGLGERIALARVATASLIEELRKDKNPRVFKTLLQNPRLTEGNLMPLVVGGGAISASLEILARDRKWGVRRPIQLALVRNRSTPSSVALGILSSLTKVELRSLVRDPKLSELLKRRCRVLLGEQP